MGRTYSPSHVYFRSLQRTHSDNKNSWLLTPLPIYTHSYIHSPTRSILTLSVAKSNTHIHASNPCTYTQSLILLTLHTHAVTPHLPHKHSIHTLFSLHTHPHSLAHPSPLHAFILSLSVHRPHILSLSSLQRV